MVFVILKYMVVARPSLRWWEKIYLPSIWGGLRITGRYFFLTFLSLIRNKPEKRVTLFYPEEKPVIPPGYRGAPTLVKDEEGREKCVACQLCEFICPPRAIRITPKEIPLDNPYAKIEKAPREFDIDMIRCIYCGMCEEVCPEEAIFLRKDYAITGLSREEMVHRKEKLYELGSVMPRPIKKWKNK
jgi:NADH-quinone oxidoreductase subunit I